jgi:hypothetical protein
MKHKEYSSKLDHDDLILTSLLYSLIWLVGFIVISVIMIFLTLATF